MKALFYFLIFNLFLPSMVDAQKVPNATTSIRNQMNAQVLAWNHADIRGFMEYYWKSDSLKFIGSKGITYGWQQTFDNYEASYPTQEAMGKLSFDIKEITVLSKTSAFVIGEWHLEKEKQVGGFFTLLWKYLDNKWVIVVDHTS